MKLRFDFVSNSSSSSFILRGNDVLKGIRLLKGIVKTYSVPYDIESGISLHIKALNRNMPELRKMLDMEMEKSYGYRHYDESSVQPDELAWDYVEIPLSESGLEKLTDEALGKTDSVEFYIGDGRSIKLILKLLYLFFQRNGCNPDALESEQEFMSPNDEEEFMYVLAGTEIPAEGRTEK